MDLKRCGKCGEQKPHCDFYRARGKRTGLQARCKACQADDRREYVRDNRERIRDSRRAHGIRSHGISPERYGEMLVEQGGMCAICRSVDPGDTGRMAIDHDHSCCPGLHGCGKCVRGLLCHRCNPMLGFSRDSPELLRAAADYLEKNPNKTTDLGRGLSFDF